MDYKTHMAVIIPSLEPDARLPRLVEDLRRAGFEKILVVNDGSSAAYDPVYHDLQTAHGCVALRHAVNLGKGRGLKNAFNYVLLNWPDCVGCVTADSDGQHSAEDIAACARALCEHPDALVLGCRRFSLKGVPFHNRMGNLITNKVTEMLSGLKVSDTQTGLRAIPLAFMARLMNVKGERFNYEMNMLLKAKEADVQIIEVPISTIYDAQGQSSHFNLWKDSARIYALFGKFILSSLFAFIVDIALFSLLLMLLRGHISPASCIFLATLGARIVSSLTNFAVNKKSVFRNKGHLRKSLLKYYILCFVQLSISAGLVYVFHKLTGLHETPVKIVVDILLFFASFQIQREWVFKSKGVGRQTSKI